MNGLLSKGIIVVFIAVTGIFCQASAETIRQPEPRATVKTPVIETEVRAPTVQTPLLREPTVQAPALRSPVISEPPVRQPVMRSPPLRVPVVAEPGVRITPQKGLVFNPEMPTPPDAGTSLGNVNKTQSGKTQSGLRIQLQPSRDKTTTGTSFGELAKEGLSEDNGKESGNINNTVRRRGLSSGMTGSTTLGSATDGSGDIDAIASSMQLVAEQMVALQDEMNSLREQMKELSPEQRGKAVDKLEQMQVKMQALQGKMEGLEQSLAQAKAEAGNDKGGISSVRRESSSANDLQGLAAKVQQNNEAKAELREQIAELKELLNDMSEGMRVDTPEGSLTKEELESKLADLEAELETMSDMSQMDMMSLQDAMNNQAQLMQMMSNIQKMMNDTSMAIIRNMK